jgi:hypothetical protein
MKPRFTLISLLIVVAVVAMLVTGYKMSRKYPVSNAVDHGEFMVASQRYLYNCGVSQNGKEAKFQEPLIIVKFSGENGKNNFKIYGANHNSKSPLIVNDQVFEAVEGGVYYFDSDLQRTYLLKNLQWDISLFQDQPRMVAWLKKVVSNLSKYHQN